MGSSTAEAGKTSWVVAYSAGTLSAKNALHTIEGEWQERSSESRRALFNDIRVVLIGGAVFDEGHVWGSEWPEGVRVLSVSDVADGVAQFAGAARWDYDMDEAHDAGAYIRGITPHCFTLTGYRFTRGGTVLGEVITAADDPADIVARFRVMPMPAEESRRTINLRVPTWKATTWHVVGHPAPRTVRVMPMRYDSKLWFDEAVVESKIGHGDSVSVPQFDYLGRVEGQLPNAGYFVEIRPKR